MPDDKPTRSPMIGTAKEREHLKKFCKLCQQHRTHQSWEDDIISFCDPEEHFHVNCLQMHVRNLVHKSTLALENVQSALEFLTLPQGEKITETIEALNHARTNLESGLDA